MTIEEFEEVVKKIASGVEVFKALEGVCNEVRIHENDVSIDISIDLSVKRVPAMVTPKNDPHGVLRAPKLGGIG